MHLAVWLVSWDGNCYHCYCHCYYHYYCHGHCFLLSLLLLLVLLLFLLLRLLLLLMLMLVLYIMIGMIILSLYVLLLLYICDIIINKSISSCSLLASMVRSELHPNKGEENCEKFCGLPWIHPLENNRNVQAFVVRKSCMQEGDRLKRWNYVIGIWSPLFLHFSLTINR